MEVQKILAKEDLKVEKKNFSEKNEKNSPKAFTKNPVSQK